MYLQAKRVIRIMKVFADALRRKDIAVRIKTIAFIRHGGNPVSFLLQRLDRFPDGVSADVMFFCKLVSRNILAFVVFQRFQNLLF